MLLQLRTGDSWTVLNVNHSEGLKKAELLSDIVITWCVSYEKAKNEYGIDLLEGIKIYVTYHELVCQVHLAFM